jgi:hypothetical protein
VSAKTTRLLRDSEPVKVYERIEVGSARTTAEALALIGTRWDNAPYEGSPFTGSFEFEMDEHRFVVSVSPLPSYGEGWRNDEVAEG